MGIEERLELFTKICEGIQHAHQKAIIHRDLKSSNVLVVEENGEAWPKIIDFGVAKVIGEKITEQTIQTQMGQILGTPEFMSPEQADLTGGSIDTRTDVYLLGEVLYELLTGLPPFDSEEMRKSGIDGMLYKIRMIDPPRPSIRLKELGKEAESLAAVRGMSADKLINLLSGDLDWIVMMAMEKSPDLRYQTAHAMIADLRNNRASLPITARPPSTSYRVRKFVNRHRTGVAAAGFVFLAIILGITGTTVGMIRSQRAEKLASTEAATAKEVSDFMVGLFEVSDPGEARGNAITAREILERGVLRIEHELSGQPFTQARLMNTMGRVYMELGLYDESRELLAKSLDTMVELDAGEDPQAAVILNDFGHLQREAWPSGKKISVPSTIWWPRA
jgi:non-specific serine/threonine protein kinase/serine/threonine-protein kinase